MADFSVIERAKRKIRFKMFPLLAKQRRLKLNNTDFTIISNNCWGGCVYEYGLVEEFAEESDASFSNSTQQPS